MKINSIYISAFGGLKNLQLDLRGIVLLDALEAGYFEEMVATLRKYTDVPICSNLDGEKLLQEADVVLTTHELQDKNLKQVFLPMLPKVGTRGEIEFMQVIYKVLCSKHSSGGMVYV